MNRLYRDIAFVKKRGAMRREAGTGTRRNSAHAGDSTLAAGEGGRFTIRVLTLNVWGLYFLPHIETRIQAICDRIGDFDVVALQEVWHSRERDVLREAGRKTGLCYAHYFACGVGLPFWPGSHGTGLLILSRLPIDDVIWKRFLVNGKPYKLHHSDYLAGRGVGLIRLRSPCGPIDVYVTHLHAMYVNSPEHDEYQAHRVGQAFEAAQFIRATARAPLVIVMGDFNSWPNSIPMQLMRQFVRLQDAWLVCNPENMELDLPNAGCTFGTEDNDFSYHKGVAPQRLDYILYLKLDGPSRSSAVDWSLSSCSLFIDYLIVTNSSKSSKIPLSDHWGVEAVFTAADRLCSPKGLASPDLVQWPLDTIDQVEWALMRTTVAIFVSGRKEADYRRTNHHRRTVAALILFPVLWLLGLDLPDFLSWIPFLVSGYAFVEMLLAQGVVTDEITAFNEILHQMRHHLRALERIGAGQCPTSP